MKRSLGVNIVISSILGAAAGCFWQLAISMSSNYFAYWATLATIGLVLNIACGHDKKEK